MHKRRLLGLLARNGGPFTLVKYLFFRTIRAIDSRVRCLPFWRRGVQLELAGYRWIVPRKAEDLGFIRECCVEQCYVGRPEFVPREGWTCLDLGANIGACALEWRRTNSTGSIHCFEPHPETFARLRANVELNRATNIQCHQVAVGDASAPLVLHVRAGHSMGTASALPGSERITVEAVTLDDFASRAGINRIDLCKIDVEGAEEAVLSHGREALSTVERIILEYHGPGLRASVLRALEPDFDILHAESSPIGLIFGLRRTRSAAGGR